MEQALPNNFPDLNTLMQYMPAVGAYQSGQQQAIAQQNNRSLQDAFAADEAFKAQKRPMDLEQLLANTANTKAQTGVSNASARNLGLAGDITEGTKASTISATNSANKTKMGADEITQMEQFGDAARQAGARAASAVTPWEKMKAIKETMGNHMNWTPESEKFFMDHIQNAHQYLSDMGNNIYEASRAAKAEASKEAAAQKRIETTTEANKEIAKANIDAGRWNRAGKVALTIDQTIDKENDPVKKFTALVAAAKEAEQGGDAEAAQHYAARAMSIKAIAEQALAAKGGGASVVIQPPGGKPQLAPKGGNTVSLPSPGGAPVSTEGQQSPTDMIKKAFGEYNPDVYEYRIGPNGQPQRKKK